MSSTLLHVFGAQAVEKPVPGSLCVSGLGRCAYLPSACSGRWEGWMKGTSRLLEVRQGSLLGGVEPKHQDDGTCPGKCLVLLVGLIRYVRRCSGTWLLVPLDSLVVWRPGMYLAFG